MNKFAKFFIGVIISLFIIWFLIANIQLSDLLNSFSSLSFKIIFLAFVFYLLSYVFRALRFRVLLNKELGLTKLFSIVCIHNFFAQIMPARIGEVSYILQIRKSGVKIGKNISSIAMARITDLIVILVIFFIGLMATPLLLNQYFEVVIAALALLILVLIVFFLIVFKTEIFIKFITQLKSLFKLKSTKYFSFFEDALHEFKAHRSKKVILLLILYSMAIWVSLYLTMFLLINSLFLQISFLNVFLIASIPVFLSLLPINGFAGFGTSEAGFLFPLLLFGIAVPEATAAGFMVHIMQLVYLIISGLIGYIISFFITNNSKN